MLKRKEDPHLGKIIAAICILGAGVFGLLRFSDWFTNEYIVKEVEASAHENIDKARKLLSEGNTVEARQILRPIIARVQNGAITPKALLLQAELDQKAGNVEAALENLRTAVEKYPDNPDYPHAAAAYARLLENTGDYQASHAVYAEVEAMAPPSLRAAALSGLARQKMRDGEPILARGLYQRAIADAPWGSAAWEEAANPLGALNVALIFSSDRTPESRVYTIEAGETLTSIGVKLNTTQGLLLTANGITDPNRVRLGQILKHTPKDFEIVIERSTLRLYLLDSDGLFKVYPTGLGRDGHATSLGSYRIGNKEKNPTWFKPGSAPIPPGDPRNELGTRWMPLIPEEEGLPSDLGIHGTINPETIGTYASLGCPRLFQEDVEELYDLVVRSTPVTIVETFTPGAGA